MNVFGEFTVAAPRSVVFKTLRDANSFTKFVDGVRNLSEIRPTHYEVLFETDVAYIEFKFNVTVEITRADGPLLKLDPVEFRRKNLFREGGVHPTGQPIKDAPFEKLLDAVVDRLAWRQPLDRGTGVIRRGRGLAIAIKAVVSPTTSVAIINVAADGSVTLFGGTVDMGQGSDTGLAQMVGEALDVPAESARVVQRDTDVTPYDMGTLGSRSLFHMGDAIKNAAQDVRSKIAGLRREVGEPEGSNTPLSELFRKRYGMQAGNVIGSGAFKPDYQPPSREAGQSAKITPFWLLSAAGAEAEVDTETGHVKIAKLVSVVDAGKIVNPKIVETQISGGALMQLGFTLFEKIHIDVGQITNASLADYKVPGIHDLPVSMESLFVEHGQSNGAFGAKGVGESSMFCISPAIANALDDAVGIRLSPEMVLRTIKVKAGCPIEDI